MFRRLAIDGVVTTSAGFPMWLNTRSSTEWEAYFGTTDWLEQDILRLCLDSDSVFVDVGANVGFYSLFAAIQCHAGGVLAFEPYQRNLDRLRANASVNGVESTLTVFPVALADFDGSGSFYVPADDSVGAGFGSLSSGGLVDGTWHGPSHSSTDVPVHRFDSLVPENSSIRLVKIDVEGHEMEVLRGMTQLLAQRRTWVLLEINQILLHIRQIDPRSITSFMAEHGYSGHAVGRSSVSRTPCAPEALRTVQNVLFVPAHVQVPKVLTDRPVNGVELMLRARNRLQRMRRAN